MKRPGVVACFILLCGISTAHAQEAAPKPTSAGLSTEEQAKRGAAAYGANCSGCHGEKLLSIAPQFPNLSGRTFRTKWTGKTVAELFDFARNMMPPKAERSLGDQVYLDIVTYILSVNKFPAGGQPLIPDPQILKQIVISAPGR
jgi:quinoprotein glucose dehydrogenase